MVVSTRNAAIRKCCTLFFFVFTVSLSCNVTRDKSNTENMDENTTTIEGTAQNGKDGALVMSSNREAYYVDGLDSWDDSVHGKQVEVTGILKTETSNEENLKNEKGEWSAGVEGEKRILYDATWRILQK